MTEPQENNKINKLGPIRPATPETIRSATTETQTGQDWSCDLQPLHTQSIKMGIRKALSIFCWLGSILMSGWGLIKQKG